MKLLKLGTGQLVEFSIYVYFDRSKKEVATVHSVDGHQSVATVHSVDGARGY